MLNERPRPDIFRWSDGVGVYRSRTNKLSILWEQVQNAVTITLHGMQRLPSCIVNIYNTINDLRSCFAVAVNLRITAAE
jgi:hypothetical protein